MLTQILTGWREEDDEVCAHACHCAAHIFCAATAFRLLLFLLILLLLLLTLDLY